MANAQQIVLTNVRLSYVHILKPFANNPGDEPKYSCTVLVPKSDAANLAKIESAIKAATEAGKAGRWNGVVPPNVPNPVHDGDGVKTDGTEYGPECKGCLLFTATAKADRPVDVVDRRMNKIIEPSEIYSGIYANISVNFYPYMYQNKKGVGAGLGPVQKVKDGESFGGSTPTANSVFSALTDEDDGRPSWL